MAIDVVIADDTPIIRDALTTLIQRKLQARVDVETAETGTEAIAVCAKHKADLLIIDERMPQMRGSEAIPQIKKQHPQIVIVGMSSTEEMEATMRRAGADFFFSKLAGWQRLETILDEILPHFPNPEKSDDTTERERSSNENANGSD